MTLTVNSIDARILVSATSLQRANSEKFIEIQERNLAMKIALVLWKMGIVQRETAPDGTVTLSIKGDIAFDETKLILTSSRSESTVTTDADG